MVHCILCSICRDPISIDSDGPCALGCGHVFHEKCVVSWERIREDQKCPNCRTSDCRVRKKVFLYWELDDDSDDEVNLNDKQKSELKAQVQQFREQNEQLKNAFDRVNTRLKQAQLAKDRYEERALKIAYLQEHVSRLEKSNEEQREKLDEFDKYFKMIIGLSQFVKLPLDASKLKNNELLITCLKSYQLTIDKKTEDLQKMTQEVYDASNNLKAAEAELAKYRANEIRFQTIIDSLKETINNMSAKRKSVPDESPGTTLRCSPRKKKAIEQSSGEQLDQRNSIEVQSDQPGTSGTQNGNFDLNAGTSSSSGRKATAGTSSSSGRKATAGTFSSSGRMATAGTSSSSGRMATAGTSSSSGRKAGLRPCRVVLKKK